MSGRVKCSRGWGEIEFAAITKSPHVFEKGRFAPYQEARCPVSGWDTCRNCDMPVKKEGYMSQSIGGSLFVYNAIKYDYCFREAILSLLAFCDQVSVLDCGSGDGTLEELEKMAGEYPALRVHKNGDWNCAPGRERLAVLANQARAHLETQWHFMLQADEVVHESSIPYIKQAVLSNVAHGYHCRRWTLYGDFEHCIRLDSNQKPCGDNPVRLALSQIPAVGDAEGLEPHACSNRFEKTIVIVHYGLVRRGSALIDKCIDMQQWFFGSPDERLKRSKEEGIFTSSDFTPETEYMNLPCSHPVYMKEWLEARSGDSTKRIRRESQTPAS